MNPTNRRPAVTRTQVTGLILAGGRGQRMGGQDKGLLVIDGRPLVDWVSDALAPQVDRLLVSANRHLDQYRALGYQVISDLEPGFQGPLAGIHSAMAVCVTPWLLTLPCDGPEPPRDLRERLANALATQQGELAVASDGSRLQPLHALLPCSLRDSLAAFLAAGERKAARWLAQQRIAVADYGDQPQVFRNLNWPEDLETLAAAFLDFRAEQP